MNKIIVIDAWIWTNTETDKDDTALMTYGPFDSLKDAENCMGMIGFPFPVTALRRRYLQITDQNTEIIKIVSP